MTLARRFNAGISAKNTQLVASATAEHINRRDATTDISHSRFPALKGRAKFIRRSATESRALSRLGFCPVRDSLGNRRLRRALYHGLRERVEEFVRFFDA